MDYRKQAETMNEKMMKSPFSMDRIHINDHPVWGISVMIGDAVNTGDPLIRAADTIRSEVIMAVNALMPQYIELVAEKNRASSSERRAIARCISDLIREMEQAAIMTDRKMQ